MKYELSISGEPSELAAILLMASDSEIPEKGAAESVHVVELGNEPEKAPEEAEPVATKAEPAPAAEKEPEVPTMEAVRNAMMAAIKAGKRDAVSGLLEARGAKRVTELSGADLPGFYAEVKAL